MTLTSAESLKDTWVSIFRRKGADGSYTRLFDNLDPSRRSTLFALLKLGASELPVIGSIQDSGNWLVLTTERLVWSIGGERREVAAGAVRDATVDLKQLQHSDSKLEMRQLQVVTMENGEHSIELEPGAPLSGVWNVLKNLGHGIGVQWREQGNADYVDSSNNLVGITEPNGNATALAEDAPNRLLQITPMTRAIASVRRRSARWSRAMASMRSASAWRRTGRRAGRSNMSTTSRAGCSAPMARMARRRRRSSGSGLCRSPRCMAARPITSPRPSRRAESNRQFREQPGLVLDHDPFGEGAPAAAGGFTHNLRFPGQIFDPETGLCNNGFRDYSPRSGGGGERPPFSLFDAGSRDPRNERRERAKL